MVTTKESASSLKGLQQENKKKVVCNREDSAHLFDARCDSRSCPAQGQNLD